MESKTVEKYPSCASNKKTSCENDCTEGFDFDPCYTTNIENNQNVTWASWHVSNGSQVVDLKQLEYRLNELTVVSEVNDKENLEITYKGKVSQDTLKVNVIWKINFSEQMAIKINERLHYNMPITNGKWYGITVG